MKLLAIHLVLAFILAFVLLDSGLVDAGRRGGGGWSSSRSRGSSSSSRGSGGLFSSIGNIFKSKRPKTQSKNPQSSYPKQTYGGGHSSSSGGYGNNRNTGGGIGGGGFVNPNQKQHSRGYQSGIGGGGFVNPGYGKYGGSYGKYYQKNNFGGGYYSGGTFKRSSSIFGTGGKRAFALGAGAGFLGGAVAAAGAMSVYHRYLQYKAMMMYMGHGNYGYGGYGYGQGYGYSPYGGGIMVNSIDCVGGCPMQAFCDYGICRCREGFEARFGNCYQNFGSIYQSRQQEFEQRTSPLFNPYKPCNNHGECGMIDMNMICGNNGTCTCRRDMKWNTEVGECQVYMDVDCSDYQPKVMSVESQTTTTPPSTTTNSLNVSDSDSSSNSTEIELIEQALPENLTEFTVNDTLKESKLTELDVNKTTPAEVKAAFCEEVRTIASRYEQLNRQGLNSYYGYNDRVNIQRLGDAAMGIGSVILIILLVVCCCGCVCICMCIKKVKDIFGTVIGQGNRKDDYTAGPDDFDNNSQGPMPMNSFPDMNPGAGGSTNLPYPPQSTTNDLPYPPQNATNNLPYPPAPGVNSQPPPYPGYSQQPSYNPSYPTA